MRNSKEYYVPVAPSLRHVFREIRFPEGWTTPHLNDCIDDKAPVCYGILMPGKHVVGGVPVIKVRDFMSGRLNYLDLLRTSPEIDHEYRRSRLKTGDILLAIRGTTGNVVVIPKHLDGGNITQDSARLRIQKSICRDFIFYVLQSQYMQKQIKLNTIGQAVKGINIAEVRTLVIPLASLPEQKKIAVILSKWDEGIEVVEKLIDAKTKLKKGLMQQLLTGKKRFKEFKGQKWNEVHLGDIMDIIMGQSPNSEFYNAEQEGIPLIQGNADILDRKTSPRAWTTHITKKCTRGDIIMAVRAPIGEVALSIHEACIGRGVCAIRAKEANCDYMYHFLVDYEPRWTRLGQGSTFTAINSSDIKRLRIKIPTSIDEQSQIASVLNYADREIDLLNKKLEALKQQKKGLMQKLLTGKIRVKV